MVIQDGCVLLIRRGQEPLRGEWSLPGGALEVGERLQEGIVREVEEETGLTVEPLEVIEVFDHITREESTGRVRFHYVLVDFRCRVTSGLLCSGTDAAEAAWVPMERLREGTAMRVLPFTLSVIEKAFQREALERAGASGAGH